MPPSGITEGLDWMTFTDAFQLKPCYDSTLLQQQNQLFWHMHCRFIMHSYKPREERGLQVMQAYLGWINCLAVGAVTEKRHVEFCWDVSKRRDFVHPRPSSVQVPFRWVAQLLHGEEPNTLDKSSFYLQKHPNKVMFLIHCCCSASHKSEQWQLQSFQPSVPV